MTIHIRLQERRRDKSLPPMRHLMKHKKQRIIKKMTNSYPTSLHHREVLGQGCDICLVKRLLGCVDQGEGTVETNTMAAMKDIIRVEAMLMTHFQVMLLQVALVLEECYQDKRNIVRNPV
jgi:hypothetical protein